MKPGVATGGKPPCERVRVRNILWLAGMALACLVTVIASAAPLGSLGDHRGVLPGPRFGPSVLPMAAPAVAPGATGSVLQLGITASPTAICANEDTACAAGAGMARVTLSANAGGAGQVVWPAVQVAFVVETTQYDGVMDWGAGEHHLDACANGVASVALCEESNGVPFFESHAQEIATAIQAANPHTTVSFAMVDYFATRDNWDDGDGAEYHVDIPQFIPAADFGQAVEQSFRDGVLLGGYVYTDSDLADNFLHSSSITALYGTIIGSGLDWANDTHHVIVWLGSSAPRDPMYPENYCISSSEWNYYGQSWGCLGSMCEPAYAFTEATSPDCEGWVRSIDGNATHSIAALAHTVPQCTRSVGGVCTIDTIDYWTTPTDPYSAGWPAKYANIGGGAGGLVTVQNVEHVLQAGCDMAAATGGTWDGPAWASCSNGQAGTLQYVPHGSVENPYTNNPTLLSALSRIGFGPVLKTQVAAGGVKPIFQFVPFGNIAPSSELQASAACVRQGMPMPSCQTYPTVVHSNGLEFLDWNWSLNASQNVMYVGDAWTASFDIVATGPPYALVPIDACITTSCKSGGSGIVAGVYTWASYVPPTNTSIVTQSFPLASIRVEIAAMGGFLPTAPPPPPAPPPMFIVTAPPVPVAQQIGIGQSVAIGNFSLQGIAAGLLSAGFMRIGIKVRPIAVRVAAKTGRMRSKFETDPRYREVHSVGHFE